MGERYTGRVFNFHSERGFGFISVDGRSDANANRVFFHTQNVMPDIVNRRCIPAGSPVSFEIVAGRNGADAAVRVCNEDPGLDEIDPETWTEYGTVRSWNGEFGYVLRPSGDGLRFSVDHIISEGIETIRESTWLCYQIGKIENADSVAWFAKQISVCADPAPEVLEPEDTVEAFFASAPELPLDETPKPAVSPLDIWSATGRKMSLADLIRRNKQAA